MYETLTITDDVLQHNCWSTADCRTAGPSAVQYLYESLQLIEIPFETVNVIGSRIQTYSIILSNSIR